MISHIKHYALTSYYFVKRLTTRLTEDRISLVSAGVAFYIFLSIFPALASVISLYGLLTDPLDIQKHLEYFSDAIPTEAFGLLEDQIIRFTESEQKKLGGGLIVGLAISMWSANKAMKAVAQSLNIAFNFKEDRSFLKVNLITLGLTFISSIAFTFTLAILIVIPVIVSSILTEAIVEGFVVLVSWLMLISAIFAVFTMLYRKAPAMHNRINTKSLIPGSLSATILLLFGSVSFSLYVANFGSYDAQYGTLASVVVTMLWLYIGAFIFLTGAEINAIILNKHGDLDSAKKRVSATDAGSA